MVRKDEPLKVTDLEAGDQVSPDKVKEQPVKKSVFDRLAYGGGGGGGSSGSRASKKTIEEQSEMNNSPAAGKAKGGKTAGKANQNKSNNKSETPVQQTTGGGGSVFDRLSSGDRSYRTTTQTGRKAAGKRAEPSNNANRKLPLGLVQTDIPVITELLDETANGSQEIMDEMDVSNEEEDPVIHISLIQPPVRSKSPRPVLKKSARLLRSEQEQIRRRKSWRLQRIPLALVERTSLARGALPILPQSLAWLCLLFNSILPGTGTILSGLLGMCMGAPRFSAHVTAEHRFLGFIINLTIGIFQAVTVLFCLVGWCWSLGWGIILVKTAGYYSRWKKSNLDSGQEEILPPHMMGSLGINNIKDDEPRY